VTPAAVVLTTIIDPALEYLAGPLYRVRGGYPARLMMTAIAGQEANWTARKQAGNGPANGLWQFERFGGVKGVLTHRVTKELARRACAELGVPGTDFSAWQALQFNDRLAAIFARLLLLSDPRPLPITEDAGWEIYNSVWRPGRPHPKTWPRCWSEAVKAVAFADAAKEYPVHA
jgi:hypothetical protein